MTSEKYCLAATALTEFWDFTIPLVMLGDWCLYENQHQLKDKDYIMVCSPYENSCEIDIVYDYFQDVETRLLPVLVDLLNDMHDESGTSVYWGYVLNAWIKQFLMICYDRYLHLREAKNEWEGLVLSGLHFSDDFIPVDTQDFIKLVWTDIYNQILLTKMAQVMNIDTNFIDSISYRKPVPLNKMHKSFRNEMRDRLYHLYCCSKTLKTRVIHNESEIILYQTRFGSEFKSKLCRNNPDIREISLIPGLSPKYHMKPQNRDQIKEKMIHHFRALNDFEKIVTQLLPYCIPSCYLEQYQELKRFTGTWFDMKKTPGAIFTSYGFWFDEPYKIWAGHHAEQGSRILHAEHSTNGVIRYGGWYIEKERCDVCYTWGWSDPKEKKGIPKSAPISTTREKMNACNSKTPILFVLTLPSRYLIRFGDPTMNSEEYSKRQCEFLSELPAELLQNVIVRHYPNPFGPDVCKNTIMAAFPGITFDNWELPFLEQLQKCRIFVADHLSTTYLESLNANKPTILISNPRWEICRERAKPYLELLIKAGILFDSPKDAARTLTMAYQDVETWWNEPKRKQAVETFCTKFLYTSDDPVREWSEEFQKYLLKT